jgi:hypothetical protein
VPAATVCRSFAPVCRTRAVVFRQARCEISAGSSTSAPATFGPAIASACSADLNQIGPPPIQCSSCFVWW